MKGKGPIESTGVGSYQCYLLYQAGHYTLVMILLHNKDENKWFTERHFLFIIYLFYFIYFYSFILFIFLLNTPYFLFFFIQIKTSHVFTFNGQHS